MEPNTEKYIEPKVTKFFGGEIELLRVEDIAKVLKVHNATIRRYIKTGRLKAQRIGKRYFITKERFSEFVNGK